MYSCAKSKCSLSPICIKCFCKNINLFKAFSTHFFVKAMVVGLLIFHEREAPGKINLQRHKTKTDDFLQLLQTAFYAPHPTALKCVHILLQSKLFKSGLRSSMIWTMKCKFDVGFCSRIREIRPDWI